MNIRQAKQEVVDTVRAYLLKDEYGEYEIPTVRQRPVLILGAPGIGKTQIMEQAARECGVALVSYTITHHTRQSAIGLPFISKKEYGGRSYSATEYTMSEIVASIMTVWKKLVSMKGFFLSTRLTVYRKRVLRQCCSFCRIRPLEITGFRRDG